MDAIKPGYGMLRDLRFARPHNFRVEQRGDEFLVVYEAIGLPAPERYWFENLGELREFLSECAELMDSNFEFPQLKNEQ